MRISSERIGREADLLKKPFQNGLPVVDAEYDRFLGLVVEEKYETWR